MSRFSIIDIFAEKGWFLQKGAYCEKIWLDIVKIAQNQVSNIYKLWFETKLTLDLEYLFQKLHWQYRFALFWCLKVSKLTRAVPALFRHIFLELFFSKYQMMTIFIYGQKRKKKSHRNHESCVIVNKIISKLEFQRIRNRSFWLLCLIQKYKTPKLED